MHTFSLHIPTMHNIQDAHFSRCTLFFQCTFPQCRVACLFSHHMPNSFLLLLSLSRCPTPSWPCLIPLLWSVRLLYDAQYLGCTFFKMHTFCTIFKMHIFHDAHFFDNIQDAHFSRCTQCTIFKMHIFHDAHFIYNAHSHNVGYHGLISHYMPHPFLLLLSFSRCPTPPWLCLVPFLWSVGLCPKQWVLRRLLETRITSVYTWGAARQKFRN